MGPRRFDGHFWRTFPAVHCGFSGLTFRLAGWGFLRPPPRGMPTPDPGTLLTWVFKMFPQVKRFQRFR